jgi:hypothetical protein
MASEQRQGIASMSYVYILLEIPPRNCRRAWQAQRV